MQEAKYWIEKLSLQKHPEGGWFKEVYRSEDVIKRVDLCEKFSGDRHVSTSIYYMLEGEEFSSFHRIKSDELWHFYTGSSSIEIIWIDDGILNVEKLGADFEKGERFQVLIPKNKWFAARLTNTLGYALAGCTVAPGFHFDDFELADKNLLQKFPALTAKIEKLIQ